MSQGDVPELGTQSTQYHGSGSVSVAWWWKWRMPGISDALLSTSILLWGKSSEDLASCIVQNPGLSWCSYGFKLLASAPLAPL